MPVTSLRNVSRPDIIAIGSSTGGPNALAEVFKSLPETFPIPIVIAQHMPKHFIAKLAERIAKESRLLCGVAKDGEVLKAGHIYIAPGDIHLKIKPMGSRLKIHLEGGAKVNHCMPSVDVLFDSLADLSPRVKTLALILTGMGDDGAKGAKKLFDKHNKVIVQDEASSTVWGMAGAAVHLGAATEILPLKAIGQRLIRSTKGEKNEAS